MENSTDVRWTRLDYRLMEGLILLGSGISDEKFYIFGFVVTWSSATEVRRRFYKPKAKPYIYIYITLIGLKAWHMQ